MTTLAERLGRDADARLLIVNCDDLGISHAANLGVYDSLRDGLATSATLMVPCPWAREAAERYRGEDIGVHLTLNAEYEPLPLGTDHPRALAARRRRRASPAPSTTCGTTPTSRRSGASAGPRSSGPSSGASTSATSTATWAPCSSGPSSSTSTSTLAVEFGLPLRLSGASTERHIGFPFRRLADEEGVVFPDHFVYLNGVGSRRTLEKALFDLPVGVTEIYVHPAVDTPEVRAIADDWSSRVDDHHLVTGDSGFRALVERTGVELIGFRELRELQRSG